MTLAQQSHASSESASREGRSRATSRNSYDTNFFDSLQSSPGQNGVDSDGTADSDDLTAGEVKSLQIVTESLSRLGRAKTLGLGVEEKVQFVNAWTGKTGKKTRRR